MYGQKGADTLTGGAGADKFYYQVQGGEDRITDFQDDKDRLKLDEALWSGTKTVAEILALYASEDVFGTVFDFGSGQVLTVDGIGLSSLSDDIAFL